MAFACSWPLQLLSVRLPPSLRRVALGVGMWAPALGALAALGRPWRAAFRDLYRPRSFAGGRRRFAIACAVLLPPAIFLVSAMLAMATGASGWNPQRPRFGLLLAGILAGTVLSPLLNFPVSLGEELGWRGFLYPALADRWGERRALVGTGLVWGVWHAPLVVNGYNYPGHTWLAVPLMVGLTSLLNVVFVALGRVGGSLSAPTLAHGAFNGMAGLSAILLTGGDPAIIPPSGLLAWVPLAAAGILLQTVPTARRPPSTCPRGS
ncbi:MAG: CPBP family intramembrane glutamic endopeptidase [Polyangia bacterium]